MKRIIAVLFVVALAFTMICACTTTQTPAVPATATTAAVPATTTQAIDWSKTSQFYHTWVAGLIAPIGLAAATIADPQAGPAIAIASKEVANLDNLLASKASGAAVANQVAILDKAVTDADAKVGAVVAAATKAANPALSISPVPTPAPAVTTTK